MLSSTSNRESFPWFPRRRAAARRGMRALRFVQLPDLAGREDPQIVLVQLHRLIQEPGGPPFGNNIEHAVDRFVTRRRGSPYVLFAIVGGHHDEMDGVRVHCRLPPA